MFSSRHPYLFFLIMLFSIFFASVVLFVFIVSLVLGQSSFRLKDGNIGVIKLYGVIDQSDSIVKAMRELRKADNIKAIVIRIDSPGGEVGPTQEIYRELRKTLSKKKVIVSMGSVAASGGYYVASAANCIIANPGTITGSIGVIMEVVNVGKILDKVGLSSVVIKSGEYKDIGSPVREITSKERQLLQAVVDDTHSEFISAISRGRGIEISIVEQIADGRVFTGRQAFDLGLVDRLGNFEDAIQLAGKLGGVKDSIRVVCSYDGNSSILNYLTGTFLTNSITDFFSSKFYIDYSYRLF